MKYDLTLDLKNLAHELGHTVNAYLSMEKEPFIYEDSTVFVGETASLANEILLNRHLSNISENHEDKIYYLSTNIENFIAQVFTQIIYTEFELRLYELVEKGEILTSKLLDEEYLKIIKKYYGDDVIYDECTKSEWSRLSKLYRWSLYVYKYATGLIIASNVVNSLVDNKTLQVDKYIEFLSSGSSNYSLELLKKLNIDLTKKKIINNSFDVLDKLILEFEELL